MMLEQQTSNRIAVVTSWLSERTGLDFSGARGRWLQNLLSGPGYDDGWARRLFDGDKQVFDQLCDAATVQESYFFREPFALAFLRDQVIPELVDQPGTVNVWSAGCAGGEEAYTLAMLLAEGGLGGRSSVLGTDLAQGAVTHAQRGVFGSWSLRGVESFTRDRRFRQLANGFAVDPRCCTRVGFAQHNVVYDDPPDAAPFDLVLCRNVLIYLTPDAVRRAAEMIRRALRPNGWLVTGVSDPSLEDVEGLEVVTTTLGTAYRRITEPLAAAGPGPMTAAAATRTSAPSLQARSSSQHPRPPVAHRRVTAPAPRAPATPALAVSASWAEDAEVALLMAKPALAERLAREALAVGMHRRTAHAVLIRALDADGRPTEALAAARQAIEDFPMAAELRGLLAVTLLQMGRPEEAHAAARRALYLDTAVPIAHLVLARSAELLGDDRTARRARRNSRQLLENGARS